MRAWFRTLSRPRQGAILGITGAMTLGLSNELYHDWGLKYGKVSSITKLNLGDSSMTQTLPLLVQLAQATQGSSYTYAQMKWSSTRINWKSDIHFETRYVSSNSKEEKWWNGMSKCLRDSSDMFLTHNVRQGVDRDTLGAKYLCFQCSNKSSLPDTWSIHVDEQRGGKLPELLKHHLETSKNATKNAAKIDT